MPYTRTALLAHALVGYEQRKTEIDDAIAYIRGMPAERKPLINARRQIYAPTAWRHATVGYELD